MPQVLDEILIADMTNRLRKGEQPADACAQIGITKNSFYRWIRESYEYEKLPEEERNDYQQLCIIFREEAEEAIGAYKSHLLKTIEAAATDPERPRWQAAAWILERRFPKEFSRTRREINAKTDNPNEATGRPPDSSLENLLPVLEGEAEEVTD